MVVGGLLASCDKETAGLMEQQNSAKKDVVRVTMTDEGPVVETFTTEEFNAMSTPYLNDAGSRNPNDKANGEFNGFGGADWEFAAVQNNGGVHGETDVSGWFGTWNFASDCIIVEGDQATVGSSVISGDPAAGFEWLLDYDYWYYRVTDNGEGSNAPADQMSNIIYLSNDLDCQSYAPSSGVWYSDGDVDGQIDVK